MSESTARGVIAAVIGAVLVGALPAGAGNVLMQIECGNPPKSEETPYQARVVNFRKGETEDRGWGIILPIDGHLDGLSVDGLGLTLKDGKVHRGFVETKELGRVFLYLSHSSPGYFMVLLPEQVDVLKERLGAGKSGG